MTTTTTSTIIELISVEASSIDKVSLYSGRAEVTRSYQVDIKEGQNQVKISGLPAVLDDDTLRVEGRGAATIQGVTITNKPPPPPPATSATLEALRESKAEKERALERCQKAITSLESYLSSIKSNQVTGAAAWELLDGYETQGEKLDARFLQLEEEIKKVNENIEAEAKALGSTDKGDDKLTKVATIDLFAEAEANVTLILTYAVTDANWEAVYDIRVETTEANQPVELTYKAAITQTTGEDWNDVSLTLETVTPTFGLELPTLEPWTIWTRKTHLLTMDEEGVMELAVSRAKRIRFRASLRASKMPTTHYVQDMDYREAEVASQGSLSTTFSVPGFVSVPSREESQSVTIVQLGLGATMHWLTIPRAEAKVHLKAKIKNDSEFPLLPGTASVYVDGSFVSKTQVPASNPQETFDCPLGPDPSIRVKYHPLSKKLTQSGFYTKQASRVYTQQITIHNTKTIPVNDLTMIDHIPISEDSQITVKLIEPALTIPTQLNPSKAVEAPPSISVSKGVTVNWDGADDPEGDMSALGRYGRIAWKCAIPEQGKVNLNLVWEVNTTAKVTIHGL
ncbi:hypothetical protein ONZ45_g12224 [Pleurotus djamor]|nr:hypothetical protein ONZ45_g12224 [Pleurotus djamor]